MELYDVFISYRRSDGRKTAEALYKYLTTKGLRVFWDIEKMEYGEAFPMQLEQAIVRAPTYVLVVTEDVFRFRQETETEKDYVRHEIRTALKAAEGRKEERPLCILDPVDGYFPNKDQLPGDVRDIADVHRIPLEEYQEEAFQKVLALATRVTCSNLWNAAHRWFYGSKEADGRFARLNICEGILPNVDRQHHQTDIPIYTSIASHKGGPEDTLPLLDALGRTEGHLYLIGEGGIGKTTALMHIMSGAYEHSVYTPGTVIPLFVELSFAPDTPGPLYDTQVASFIRRSVYRQLRTDLQFLQDPTWGESSEDVFNLPDEVAVEPITKLFSRRTAQPEILLLLDGLNEVSTVTAAHGCTVMEMVIGEINYLMRHCPNVRIVLTSRFNDTDIGGNTATRLYLQGLEQDSITEYLMLRGFSEQRIQSTLSDENLSKSLQIPLFLTMYASISEENTATAQGEILHIFFHERSRNLSLYTNQDRLQSLEENSGHAGRTIQNSRITAQMFRFMLDFVLPEFGWYMERKGLFHISDAQAQQLITGLLTGTGPDDVLGPAGRVVFSQYGKSGSRRHHVQKCAADLRQVLGSNDPNNMVSITDSILTCCMTTLGILQDTNGHCGFVHQHIRDYFAAVRIINTMRIAIYLQEQNQSQEAITSLAPVLKDAPLDLAVCRFLGESLGEHKNKPLFMRGIYRSAVPDEECDRNLLERLLNIYRNRFDGLDGYSLHSILKILTEVRGSLAGCDLSRLDLTGCDLSGSKIGLSGLSANVNGAKLSSKELFYSGHTDKIHQVHFNADGTQYLSYSGGNTVFVWDSRSGLRANTISLPRPALFLCFTPQSNRILAITRTEEDNLEDPGTVTIYHHAHLYDVCKGQEILNRSYTFIQAQRFALSPDGQLLLCFDFFGHRISILSAEDLHVVYDNNPNLSAEDTQYNSFIQAAAVGSDNRSVVICRYCNIQNQHHFDTLLLPLNSSQKARILPELHEKEVLIASTWQNLLCTVSKADRKAEFCITDIHTGRILHSWNLEGFFAQVRFSNDGRYLLAKRSDAVFIYETKNFTLYHIVHPTGDDTEVTTFDYSPNQQMLMLGTKLCSIQTFETRDWTLLNHTKGINPNITSGSLSPDGLWLVTGTDSGLVSLWDICSHTLRAQINLPGTYDFRLSFSSDSQLLCVYRDLHSHLYRLPDLLPIMTETGEGCFSPDGHWIWFRFFDSQTVFSMNDLDCPLHINHKNTVAVLDPYFITLDTPPIDRKKHSSKPSSAKKSCNVYELHSGKLVAQLNIPGQYLTSAVLSPRHLAISSQEGHVRIFRTGDFSLVTEYKVDLKPDLSNFSISFSPQGNYLIEEARSSPNRYLIRIREMEHFRVVFSRKDIFGTLFFTPGEKLLAEISNIDFNQDRISLYTVPTFEPHMSFNQYHASFFPCSVDADATCIALQTEFDKVTVYPLIHDTASLPEWTAPFAPSLEVRGVDLRKLHPDSAFTPEELEILRAYGAIIE